MSKVSMAAKKGQHYSANSRRELEWEIKKLRRQADRLECLLDSLPERMSCDVDDALFLVIQGGATDA